MKSDNVDIRDLARRDLVFVDVDGRDRTSILKRLASMVSEKGTVACSADRLYESLWEREELQSTGVGDGIAIPHCKVRGLKEVIMAVATCSQDVDFDAPDGQPVRLVFLLLSPAKAAVVHLRSLAALSSWLRDQDDLADRLVGRSADDIFAVLVPESDGPTDTGIAAGLAG